MSTAVSTSTQDELRAFFEELRAREFGRLDVEGQVYLDYTGSGLYAQGQIRDSHDFLQRSVLGNPHSENPASTVATRLVNDARADVLDFFGADPDEYTVIFTSNASAALKLVGESLPFRAGSRFTLLEDDHNSVHGIRMYAQARGAATTYLPLTDELRLDRSVEIPPAPDETSLFAFPAQSNFSGVKHPLSLIDEARDLGYTVLLDAAAYAPTSPVDLRSIAPDFVSVSFYKMFGYPTGIGALVARKDALARLERPWFAGGTVEFVSTQTGVHRLRADAESFEDGTPDFLGIAAVSRGLAFLRDVGMERVSVHIGRLTERVLRILTGARWPGGAPAVVLYGPEGTEMRGGTVAFNFLDPDGRVLPFAPVERAASGVGISLRGGCFCNPGAAERALDLPAQEALDCFRSIPQGGFSLGRFAECMGPDAAVGALRVSVGIPTNDADLDRFEAFVADLLARGPEAVS